MGGEFNCDFYRFFHEDITKYNFTDEELKFHYDNYGKHEGRLTCEKQFYEVYPDFDVNFYVNFYDDLSKVGFNNYQLMKHYKDNGIREERLICNENFYGTFSNFDIKFYYHFYNDLSKAGLHSKYRLMKHYEDNGIREGRLICEKQFYEAYPEFDNDNNFYVNFHKDTNVECSNIEKYKLMKKYQDGDNENYFKNNFIVKEDYTFDENNIDTELIYSHYFFRKINNFEDLLKYNNKYIKNYTFFDKKSFYRYYNNFDYEYYKNRYFKDNSEITECEILYYYHTNGKNNRHIINNKINIIIYTPPFNVKCGGIVVMHYLAKLINEKYNDKYQAKLFMHNNIRYENPFCNDFARIDEINDNTVVIYPEIVSGNPLNAKNVVRWILLELGIEMPLDHYKNWNSTDLIYHWEKIDKQLCCPFFNPIFKNNNLQNERTETCYLVKKGPLVHKNINYIHPPNSVCIDNLSLNEINNMFNKCKYFYSYDANTAYIMYAAVCGCIPIIHEIDGVSEEEFFKNKVYNFENNIYNRGIVYGNNLDKINYILENELNKNNEGYYRHLFDMCQKQTIPPFLENFL